VRHRNSHLSRTRTGRWLTRRPWVGTAVVLVACFGLLSWLGYGTIHSAALAHSHDPELRNGGRSITSANSLAATPTPPADPSSTPSAARSSAVPAATRTLPASSAGCSAAVNTPDGPDPSGGCWPGPDNTGPTGCASYTVMTGDTEITTAGTVIDCAKVTGSFDVYASNVTIENSFITSSNWWGVNLRDPYTNLQLLHDTIMGVVGQGPDNGGEDYGISDDSSGSITAAYNNISEFGEGLSFGQGTIEDNYIHDLQQYTPLCGSSPCGYFAHTNAWISDGGNTGPMLAEHNTFYNWMDANQGGSGSVSMFSDGGAVTDQTVTDNLIAGGGYCVYPGGGSTSSGVVITDNYFSTVFFGGCGSFGPDATSYWHTGSGNEWSGNVWADGPDVGQPVSP
jgi:hypothetical protein